MPPKHSQSTDFSPLEVVFDQCYPAIYRYFRFRGTDQQMANDLASSVFERALSKFHLYDQRKADVRTWLFSIARNIAINSWKKGETNPTVSIDDEELLTLDDAGHLEKEIVLKQEKEDVVKALQHLDKRSSEIIALKFGGEFTNRKISELTGLSESNVGVILYRSILKLRQILAETQSEANNES